MQNKLKNTKADNQLRKFSSAQKFTYLQNHSLNKSPTKNVPSFHTGSLRFLKPSSVSLNKFYDVPDFKSKKSVSFGFGTKTNFEKKQFIQPTRYRINSSFDIGTFTRRPGPTFGISRQDFNKGKLNQEKQKLGPGTYNLERKKSRSSFYMGLKLDRKDTTLVPGPGAYNAHNNESYQFRKNSLQLRIKAPRIKTQYFEKAPLDSYNNKVPGPGAYDLNSSENRIMIPKLDSNKSRLPQCPRFKVRQDVIPPPGKYQSFSQFGV